MLRTGRGVPETRGLPRLDGLRLVAFLRSWHPQATCWIGWEAQHDSTA